MAVPIYTVPQGESGLDVLATGLGTGLGSVLQGLAAGKVKQMQGKQFEQMGLPSALAYLDPKVQSSALKQLFAAQQMSGQMQQAGDQLSEIEDINKKLWSLGGRTFPKGSSQAQRFEANVNALKPLFRKLGLPVPSVGMNQRDVQDIITQARQKMGQQPGVQQQMPQQQMPQQQMPQQQMPQQQMPQQQMPQQQMPQPGIEQPSGLEQQMQQLGMGQQQAEQPSPYALTPFEQERQLSQEDQGYPEYLAHLLGVGGKAAASGIAGLPGELASFLGAGGETKFSGAAKALAEDQGEEYKPIAESIGEKSPVKLRDLTIQGIDEGLTKAIESVVGKGAVTPQGSVEKVVDRAIKEFAPNAMLGGPWKQMITLGASALGGNAAAEMAKQGGYSPLTQSIAHLTFGLAPVLAQARSPMRQQEEAGYNTWKTALTDDPKSAPAARITDAINKADTMIAKNPASGTGTIKEQMKAIQGMVQEGKIPMLDVWTKKKDLNELKYKELADKEISKTANDAWKVIQDSLLDVLHKDGAKLYPKVYPGFKNAEKISTGLALGESSLATLGREFFHNPRGFSVQSALMRGILNNAKKMPITAIGMGAGGIGGYAAGATLPGIALGVGGGAAAQEAWQYAKFLANTPGASKQIMKLVGNSIARRPAAIQKYFKSVDALASKYEKKEQRRSKR